MSLRLVKWAAVPALEEPEAMVDALRTSVAQVSAGSRGTGRPPPDEKDVISMFSLLSKSRVLAGVRCERLLWLVVHDRDAPELVPDADVQSVLNASAHVGRLARELFPGGTLIPDDGDRVRATLHAISAGASVIYEASFMADDVFVAVDVLIREPAGWRLVEVKAATSVEDSHVLDAAVQVHVLERSGINVDAIEIMRVNRNCRHPDLADLFVREDVTQRVREAVATVPASVARELMVLGGALPETSVGRHCAKPYPCPFRKRCASRLPANHVSTLYRGRRCAEILLAAGIDRIEDVDTPLDGVRERQRRAVQSGTLVIEGDLAGALAAFVSPMAFIDFETVGLAIPRWTGCAPYDAVPVQFSVHLERAHRLEHRAWLADGPDDPRPTLARALLDACAEATTIVAYNAGFERCAIEHLAAACPELATPLLDLASRLVDLLPVVREHIYHPGFRGSFGLKAVLPALVGDNYSDLMISSGTAASAALTRLLFEEMPSSKRVVLRRDLESYCARDTLGLVHLLRRLRELAKEASP